MGALGHPPFVQAAYDDGVLASSILDCPFGRPGEPCAVSLQGHRVRKTGPVHRLVVLRCHVHERAFTVYPPGFVPYARRQLCEGPVQHDVPSLARAVQDTATHGPRKRTPDGGVEGSWCTQQRLLQLVSELFGLPALERSLQVANASGLTLSELRAAAMAVGCRALAQALQPMMDLLPTDDLLVLGALMGCWGTPHRWSAERDQLIALTACRGPPRLWAADSAPAQGEGGERPGAPL